MYTKTAGNRWRWGVVADTLRAMETTKAMLVALTCAFLLAGNPAFGTEPPSWPTAKSAESPVDTRSIEAWRSLILPDQKQEAWAEIPWRPTFWEAVLEAERARKPVLFWAMNGHPLGCT